MDMVSTVVDVINEWLWYGVTVVLIVIGLYLSLRTKGVQLSMLPEMFRVVKEPSIDDDEGNKQISSFRAFTISAAARVGTGNIAGVALAISLGGPGSVFWMWLLALIGGATSFVESTLAQAYKVRDKESFVGGPAHYMERGLGRKKMAMAFAVIMILTYGFVFASVQSNSVIDVLTTSVRFEPGTPEFTRFAAIVGVVLTMVAGFIFFSGTRALSGVTVVVVPIMAVIYLLIGAVIMVMNANELPGVMADIVLSAFGIREFAAGTFFAVVINGVRRGLYSNEAGMGSAPIAGAAASVSHPAKQGFVQTLGVYFDTWLVCTVTAFIVLLSNPVYGDEARGASLTQEAMALQLGDWAIHFLTVAMFLFAFSSVLGAYYCGEANVKYLSSSRTVLNVYRAIVCGFVFWGAVASLDLVWAMADVTMGIMATLNLVGVIMLAGVAVRLLANYREQRRRGLDPAFHADDLKIHGMDAWDGSDPVTRRE